MEASSAMLRSPMNPNDVPRLEIFEREALEAVKNVLRAGRRLIIAYSGGKDSTTILLIALNAARDLAAEGVSFPPVLITHGDTGVENPLVAALVRQELAKARLYGANHLFEVQAEIAVPLLNDTWAVSILSGRKIPTFANAGTRDCTVMFKIDPMTRLRNKVLKAEKRRKDDKKPVTLIGTRFEESDGRATRMTERGETAYVPWKKKKAWFMSVIANWEMGDVWAYLAKYRDGKLEGFTDAQAVFDMYANATDDNTCAVVGDMATEGAKKSRACGARFGCALCAAVGRDKSLEALLNRPENGWLRPLNRIQRFIVDTQHDWSRRNWLGRTLEDGYIAVTPDTYSPAMLAELLRYCLTADVDEAAAAGRAKVAPRFCLVSKEQLLAIDALWSLNGIQERPFAALKIWQDVYEDGMRFYPPDVKPVPPTPKPVARYMKVGADWEGGRQYVLGGFREVTGSAWLFGGAGCIGSRALEDGRAVLDASLTPSFSFDAESVEMFFGFEMEYALEQYHSEGTSCTAAFMHYSQLGMLGASNNHVNAHIDRILRRTAWKKRNGLVGVSDPSKYLPQTVSRAEMRAAVAAARETAPEG